MNYTIPSTDAFPWGPALVLLAAFAVLTVGLFALAWWRRWRFSLKWLFIYTAIWAIAIPIIDRCWIRARGVSTDTGTSGMLFWEAVDPADEQRFIELVTSDRFKLECARHLAPRTTLERLLAMPHKWKLARDDKTGRFDGVEFEMGDLTAAEARLMARWEEVWRSETYHTAAVLSLLHDGRPPAVNHATALWITSNPQGGSDSFDWPPRTEFVRRGMVEIIEEHPDKGVRAYCRRQLRAARSLDQQVGFDPDPLLAEENVKGAGRQP